MQAPRPGPDKSDALQELAHVIGVAQVEADFGLRVREARQIAGMTQKQLADIVGLDASAISRLEQGSRAIRLGEAALIAEALKADVRELVYGESSNDPRLELYEACDDLEDATAQLRDATLAAENGVAALRSALERPEVQEYLSTTSIDAHNVINLCSYVLELFQDHDHPRLLRKLSAELFDRDQPHLFLSKHDGPNA